MRKFVTRIQPQRKVVKVFVCWWGKEGEGKVVRNVSNTEGDGTV